MPKQVALPPVEPADEAPVRKVIEAPEWMNHKWDYTVHWNELTQEWEVMPF